MHEPLFLIFIVAVVLIVSFSVLLYLATLAFGSE